MIATEKPPVREGESVRARIRTVCTGFEKEKRGLPFYSQTKVSFHDYFLVLDIYILPQKDGKYPWERGDQIQRYTDDF